MRTLFDAYVLAMDCDRGDMIDDANRYNGAYRLCIVRMNQEILGELWLKNRHEHNDYRFVDCVTIPQLGRHFLLIRSRWSNSRVIVVSLKNKCE